MLSLGVEILLLLLILGIYTAPVYAKPEFQADTDPNVPTAFQITFDELGYDEVVLESPLAQTEYAFRLPQNWVVEQGSILDIEFSFFFGELVQKEGLELQQFGDISISMDGLLLGTYALDARSLERVRWRIALPPDLFNEDPGDRHEINLALDAWFLCDTPHTGKLIVHPTSTLSLNYSLISPTLDLADYPRPFSQWAFEKDRVWFVLPDQPSEAEVRTATVVAAGLGDLAGSSMIISATTDVAWLRSVAAGQAGDDHLFVIGQPGRNQLLTWLNEADARPNEDVSLPVPMRRRELALSSRGPGAVMPGQIFTYTIDVTNTTSARAQNLNLIYYLPLQVDLVSCDPEDCRVEDGEKGKQVSWSLPALAPEENATLSLELQLADAPGLSATITTLENLVVLADREDEPINISSLSTAIGDEPAGRHVSSSQNDYFFVRDGRPVFEGDGILQELISPWDPQRVMLLITGLDDQAVHKAGQSLSLKTGLGVEGMAALVRKIQPSPPVTETLNTDFTFADLGYGERTLYGFHPRSLRLDYYFDVPRGWRYTNEAYLILQFGHSEAIDPQSSTLSVLLNGSPLATVPLDEDNAIDGSLRVDLPSANIKPGDSNRLSIQPVMQIGEEAMCQSAPADDAWVKIYQNSSMHLEQRVEQDHVLDLDDFPFPFDDRPDLSDVLFTLPSIPESIELEALFRIVSIFGGAAEGAAVNPKVVLGDVSDVATLRNYDIVAIGRPTRSPLIQEINDILPQPFVPGTDEVVNQWGEVLLRLPPDIPLGYIQEIPSPWNEDRPLLAVTGTGQEGVASAVYALTRYEWRLDGDLVLVRKGEEEIDIHAFDTRRLTSSGQAATLLTAVPELTLESTPTVTPTLESGGGITPTLTPTPFPEMSPSQDELPIWVVAFVGVAGLFVVVLVAIGAWQFWQRRH